MNLTITTIPKQIEAKSIKPNLYFSNYLSEPVDETLTLDQPMNWKLLQ